VKKLTLATGGFVEKPPVDKFSMDSYPQGNLRQIQQLQCMF
jgi:hypothetical protein